MDLGSREVCFIRSEAGEGDGNPVRDRLIMTAASDNVTTVVVKDSVEGDIKLVKRRRPGQEFDLNFFAFRGYLESFGTEVDEFGELWVLGPGFGVCHDHIKPFDFFDGYSAPFGGEQNLRVGGMLLRSNDVEGEVDAAGGDGVALGVMRRCDYSCSSR